MDKERKCVDNLDKIVINSQKQKNISEDAKGYIKRNRKLLIEKISSLEKFPPVDDPFSIFMAGSPGAGKTEFSKQLIKLLHPTSIVRIDADDIRELIPYYNGKNSDLVQGAAALGVEKIYDYVLKYKQNMIMDGTFAKYKSSKENIRRSFKKNRKIGLFYLYQDPLIAWDFVKKREILEGRFIPKEAFIESFFQAKENVNLAKKEWKEAIELNLVVKNFSNGIEKIKFNIENIDNFLKIPYNKKSLIKALC